MTEATLIAHVKTQLAPYKAPRHIFAIAQLYRAPNGKLDYPRAKQLAQTQFAALTKD